MLVLHTALIVFVLSAPSLAHPSGFPPGWNKVALTPVRWLAPHRGPLPTATAHPRPSFLYLICCTGLDRAD
jgi:hypothetical protein